MLSKLIQSVRSEWISIPKWQRLFVLFAMISGFLISMDASIIKPVSNSCFLARYGIEYYPLVWLAIIPINLCIVHFYNHFVTRFGPYRTLIISLLTSVSINILSSYWMDRHALAPFFYYIWKDIYILLMFQQLWSVIHSTLKFTHARYLYGIFYGMGGLGSVLGSTIPGFYAVRFGTAPLLLTTIPIQLALAVFYLLALRVRSMHPDNESLQFEEKKSSFKEGVSLIQASSLLRFILMLVIFMQMISTLIDFNFNHYIEHAYPLKDVRTEYLGRFFGILNVVGMFFQFIGSFVLMKFVGFKRSHMLIPLYLGSTVLTSIFYPGFSTVAFSFASTKAVDYSVFGILKGMLYLPLGKEEKFKAKSIIDIFAYRSAKALASLLILFLEAVAIFKLPILLSWASFILFIAWAFTVHRLFSLHDKSLAK